MAVARKSGLWRDRGEIVTAVEERPQANGQGALVKHSRRSRQKTRRRLKGDKSATFARLPTRHLSAGEALPFVAPRRPRQNYFQFLPCLMQRENGKNCRFRTLRIGDSIRPSRACRCSGGCGAGWSLSHRVPTNLQVGAGNGSPFGPTAALRKLLAILTGWKTEFALEGAIERGLGFVAGVQCHLEHALLARMQQSGR